MLLVDDYTKWCQVYMLKTKDQATETFVKYKAEVKNNSRLHIKTLRFDRGVNFLPEFFRVCAIKLELSISSQHPTHLNRMGL